MDYLKICHSSTFAKKDGFFTGIINPCTYSGWKESSVKTLIIEGIFQFCVKVTNLEKEPELNTKNVPVQMNHIRFYKDFFDFTKYYVKGSLKKHSEINIIDFELNTQLDFNQADKHISGQVYIGTLILK